MSSATIGDLKDWGEPNLDTAADATLQRCLDAAEAWVERVSGHPIAQQSFTLRLNGADAVGRARDTIYLPIGHRPVAHTGGDLVTVSEDGVALTLAEGYDADADVLIRNAGVNEVCVLQRNGIGWSNVAPDNIEVSYKAGWTAGNVPADVIQLLVEAAWLMFKLGAMTGKQSVSKSGTSATFERQLSPFSRATLDALRSV